MRIDPYVYTHRIADNNYTSQGFQLSSPYQPNSSLFDIGLNYYPHYRLNVKFNFLYSKHGANLLDEKGELKINYGGDIDYGIRSGDPQYVSFLQGAPEYFRRYTLSARFEPVNNYFLLLDLVYTNNSLQGSIKEHKFDAAFGLYLVI
jgi:hypothetical protein